MADNAAFYYRRAAEERANADAATLDNVRERCERAAAAWETMAARSDRVDQHRAEREAAIAHRDVDAGLFVADPAAN
jgi:hypothetical protein